ncbi:MAG: UPF0149 family protein [Holosporaceae bacterium]|nr:UPF0149 family protein [Holosporaceae bacterium]
MLPDWNNEVSKPLCDEEVAQLSEILDTFPNEDAMTLEMLDGFFTALHCCPNIIPASAYIPKIFGEDSLEAELPFDDEHQFHFFLGLLTRYWDDVADRLCSGKYGPRLEEDSDDAGYEWAIGFLLGVDSADDAFSPIMKDEEESIVFFPIFILAFQDTEDSELCISQEEITPELREELLIALSFSVTFMYHRLRLKQNNIVLPELAQWHKMGRNDPCPCGSGKKYKKCCLNRVIH